MTEKETTPTPGAPAVRRAGPTRFIGRMLGYMAMLGFSLAIAALLAEFAVRLAAPQQLIVIQPELWEPADTVGYLRRANVTVPMNTGERDVTVRTDADGFRVGATGREDASIGVLLMGDSFIEALQVEYEQTTGALLDSSLTASLGKPVAVRNAGVSGWGPNQYFLRTRSLVARDRYSLVVVGVFVGNDAVPERVDHLPPREPVRKSRLRFPRGLSRAELVNSLAAPLNDALEVRSHAYVLLKNQLATLRMKLGLTADYMPLEYRRAEATAGRWQVAAGLLEDLAKVAEARGAPTLFVLIPERFQVYEDEFARYLAGFGIDSSTVDVDQPSRLLFEAMTGRGLHVVDALPVFRAAASSGGPRLFGRVDQHLSPTGHVVLAQVIADEAARLIRR